MCDQPEPLPTRRLALAACSIPLAALLASCTRTAGPIEHAQLAAAAQPASTGRATASPSPTSSPQRLDLDDPRSLQVVVDKHRPLRPKSWIPPDLVAPDVPHTNAPQLRKAAAHALERMFAAADHDGVTLVSLSAYRPYTVQRRIYDRNLAALGRTATEKLTLRPGYSEHQTGLAIDIGGASRAHDLSVAFGTTAEAAWLRARAWRHGWLLRYEHGKKPITGIQYEPWHYRYVGTQLAAAYHRAGAHTLEQYLGLPAAPGYA